MFSSKSAFLAGLLALLLGAGQFVLAFFGRSFRFYYYFGGFWPLVAGFFCLLGVGLMTYPWTKNIVKTFLDKRKDKNK